MPNRRRAPDCRPAPSRRCPDDPNAEGGTRPFTAVHVSTVCETAWEALSEDERDTLAFDREQNPRFVLTRIDWNTCFQLSLVPVD